MGGLVVGLFKMVFISIMDTTSSQRDHDEVEIKVGN